MPRPFDPDAPVPEHTVIDAAVPRAEDPVAEDTDVDHQTPGMSTEESVPDNTVVDAAIPLSRRKPAAADPVPDQTVVDSHIPRDTVVDAPAAQDPSGDHEPPLPAGESSPQRPPLEEQHLWGIGLTVGIHLFIVIAMVVLSQHGAPDPSANKKEKIIDTTLVRIKKGDQRGTKERGPLYRSKKNVKRRRPPMKHTAMAPLKRPNEVLSHKASINYRRTMEVDPTEKLPDWFNKKYGMLAPPGAMASDQAKGSPEGMSPDGLDHPCAGTQRQIVGAYTSRVSHKVRRFKRPPFVSAAVAENLTAKVWAEIDGDGDIKNAGLYGSSGNPRFDAAAVAHVRGIGKVAAPPPCALYVKKRNRMVSSRRFYFLIRAR